MWKFGCFGGFRMGGLLAGMLLAATNLLAPSTAQAAFGSITATLDGNQTTGANGGMTGTQLSNYGSIAMSQSGIFKIDVAITLVSGYSFLSLAASSTNPDSFAFKSSIAGLTFSGISSGYAADGDGTIVGINSAGAPSTAYTNGINVSPTGTGTSTLSFSICSTTCSSGTALSMSMFTAVGTMLFSAELKNGANQGVVGAKLATASVVVPEPATMALVLGPLGLVAALRRRRAA
jgi:hypothetical protein